MENWIQQKFDIDLSFPKSRGLGKIHVDPFFHKNSDLYNPGQSSNTVRDFFLVWLGLETSLGGGCETGIPRKRIVYVPNTAV